MQPALTMVNRFLAIVVLLMTQMSAANAATKTPFAQKVRVGAWHERAGRLLARRDAGDRWRC